MISSKTPFSIANGKILIIGPRHVWRIGARGYQPAQCQTSQSTAPDFFFKAASQSKLGNSPRAGSSARGEQLGCTTDGHQPRIERGKDGRRARGEGHEPISKILKLSSSYGLHSLMHKRAGCRQTGRFERSFGRRAASQTVGKTGQTAKQAMQQEGQALSDLARKRRSRKAEKTSQLSTVSLFCFFS